MSVRRVLPLLFVLLVPEAEAAVFRVGSDAACTHATIQSAIDAAAANGAGQDSIRIAIGSYTAQALLIENHWLQMGGGYVDCSATFPTPGARSAISGAGNGGLPVLRILQSDATFGNTGLAALDISGGDVGAGDGGGIRAIGSIQLYLTNTRVHDNRAARGGGIYVRGTPGQQVLSLSVTGYESNDSQSRIEHNVASDGGGVYVDSDASVSVNSPIAFNAAERGGGVFVSGTRSAAGVAAMPQSAPGEADIHDNEASLDGGGVYASGGAVVFATRHAGIPAPQIRANRAGRDGGGVYLDHARLTFLRGFVRDNHAGLAQDGRGGGIYVGSGAGVGISGEPLDSVSDLTCLSSLPCAGIIGNRAGSEAYAGQGGGFYAEGSVGLYSAALQDNSADDGAAATMTGNAAANLYSLLVTGNDGGGSLLSLSNGRTLELRGSTLAANLQEGELLRLDAAAANIRGSILHQPAGGEVTAINASTLSTQCVLAASDFHPEGDVVVALPGFADANAGDFSLVPDSPALDACADFSEFDVDDYDHALQVRGIDLPEVTDVGGPYDIGAFETQLETHRPPLADDVSATMPQDTALTVTLLGSDPDGDALTFRVIEAPQHGSVSDGVPPDVIYRPAAGYVGTDSFRYVANDGAFDSAPARVSITVTEVIPLEPDIFASGFE